MPHLRPERLPEFHATLPFLGSVGETGVEL